MSHSITSIISRINIVQRLIPGSSVRRKYYCTTTTSTTDPNSIKVLGVEIGKSYNPLNYENNTREKWKLRDKDKIKWREGRGLEGEAPLFRMILPPPNVTGKLHLGHALTVAIQDTICRLKYMTGSRVEWIPGFDHAGIATQALVTRKLQRKLQAQNIPIDPEKLDEQLHNYADCNRETISNQLEALGALLDWEKCYYTLDKGHSKAVNEAFLHLFESGIIKRADGIVNWSCPLETSISDIEVEEIGFTGKTLIRLPGCKDPVEFGLLYFIEYSVPNYHKNLVIATSRPETMFGDTAVAVNPDDPNHKEFIGRLAVSPLTGMSLQIIGDPRIRTDFGTGAVKITPAHDKVDFAIGTHHGLPSIKSFTPGGKLTEDCGEFSGRERFEVKKAILDVLKDKGVLVESKEYVGNVGLCSRTRDVVEPFAIPHWYLRTGQLTLDLLDSIKKGEFIVRPDYQMHNLVQQLQKPHDWCLSRQIQWGHQVPAYYHQDYPNSWVAATSEEDARKFLEKKLNIKIQDASKICQDPDVLDTWFSSSLIPLSIVEWPDDIESHQLSVLETGYDIVLFWVWRMGIMSLALTGKLPFQHVLLHGVVTDAHGRKMSKSKGNVIDPMDVLNGKTQEELSKDTNEALKAGELDLKEHELRIEGIRRDLPKGIPACGADALRFSLLGHDISLQQIKLNMTYVDNCKRFCNKLWQAMRFYFLHEEHNVNHPIEIAKPKRELVKSFADQWILACLYEFAKEYETTLMNCQFHLGTEAIRNFLYGQYCDVYLELVKKDLRSNLRNEHHMLVMRYAFCTALKLSHPFLPFVTEEIWYNMTEGKMGLLVDQSLTSSAELEEFRDDAVVNAMRKGLQLAKEIRNLRVKYLSGSKDELEVFLDMPQDEVDIVNIADSIETLTRMKLRINTLPTSGSGNMVGETIVIDGAMFRIHVLKTDIVKVPNLINESKLLKMKATLDKLKRQYENPAFQQFAPTEAKDRLKRRLDLLQSKIDQHNSASTTQGSEHN